MNERLYLDWNATAPLRREARAAMLAAMEVDGNPSSVHAEGRAARRIVEEARKNVASLVGTEPRNVTFTSGGTEAITAALMAMAGVGDEVVMIEPTYDSYRPMAEAAGAVVKAVKLEAPGWRLTTGFTGGPFELGSYVGVALLSLLAWTVWRGRREVVVRWAGATAASWRSAVAWWSAAARVLRESAQRKLRIRRRARPPRAGQGLSPGEAAENCAG